jgi:hypothetical protein
MVGTWKETTTGVNTEKSVAVLTHASLRNKLILSAQVQVQLHCIFLIN